MSTNTLVLVSLLMEARWKLDRVVVTIAWLINYQFVQLRPKLIQLSYSQLKMLSGELTFSLSAIKEYISLIHLENKCWNAISSIYYLHTILKTLWLTILMSTNTLVLVSLLREKRAPSQISRTIINLSGCAFHLKIYII